MKKVTRSYFTIRQVDMGHGWVSYEKQFLGDMKFINISYVDYDQDDNEVGSGNEDFSLERYLKVMEINLNELVRNNAPVKSEVTQTTFAQYINANRYNQVFTSDIEKFSSELLSIMIAKEGEVRRTGQDFGGWNYEVINNRILVLELGAWRYGQKIKWDMEKNCIADSRKKEYRELIKK